MTVCPCDCAPVCERWKKRGENPKKDEKSAVRGSDEEKVFFLLLILHKILNFSEKNLNLTHFSVSSSRCFSIFFMSKNEISQLK
jgi:hypothetical protein